MWARQASQTLLRRALTIHSSRSRFAARLNSGVRPALNNFANRRDKALLLAIPLVTALMFAWLSGIEAYRWHLLSRSTIETHAAVTDARRNPPRKAFGGPPFQIRYVFRRAQNDRAFHYTGQFLITERWARVPEHVWDLARTGSVLVRYSVSDPRVNQPAALPIPTWYQAAGFGAFSLFALLAAWLGYRDLSGRSNNSFKPKPLRGSA